MAHNPPSRVLIVDDDPDWRGFLRLCLDDLGYEAVEACNGAEALELLRHERFEVLLLDLYMPGLDGREVLEQLPSPAPRVVLLTSAAPDQVSGMLAGHPCYYLPKEATSGSLSLILDSLHD